MVVSSTFRSLLLSCVAAAGTSVGTTRHVSGILAPFVFPPSNLFDFTRALRVCSDSRRSGHHDFPQAGLPAARDSGGKAPLGKTFVPQSSSSTGTDEQPLRTSFSCSTTLGRIGLGGGSDAFHDFFRSDTGGSGGDRVRLDQCEYFFSLTSTFRRPSHFCGSLLSASSSLPPI